MVWVLLAGCLPGNINTPQGSDRLVTALYQQSEEADRDVVELLLANSELDCELRSTSLDPAELVAADADLFASLFRENARIVAFDLYRFRVQTWAGYLPLVEDTVNDKLDDLNPYAARALYWGVNEAEVDEDEGLYRTYIPVDVDYHERVAEPGEVLITKDEDGVLVGTFRLDAIDVSGNFRATECEGEATIFDLLPVLRAYDPEDLTDLEADD